MHYFKTIIDKQIITKITYILNVYPREALAIFYNPVRCRLNHQKRLSE